MGLAEDEVGRLTLAEFDALIKRKQAADDRAQLNAGIIAAAVFNSQGGVGGKAILPTEFVPSMCEQKEHDLTQMTPEAQKEYIFKMFGTDPKGRSLVEVKG